MYHVSRTWRIVPDSMYARAHVSTDGQELPPGRADGTCSK